MTKYTVMWCFCSILTGGVPLIFQLATNPLIPPPIEVSCTGSEQNIQGCQLVRPLQCFTANVGVNCTGMYVFKHQGICLNNFWYVLYVCMYAHVPSIFCTKRKCDLHARWTCYELKITTVHTTFWGHKFNAFVWFFSSALQNCVDGELRLVGGPSEREGRLEMCYRGVWGAISDNEWDNVDATVACRQLGFEPSGMYTRMVIRQF